MSVVFIIMDIDEDPKILIILGRHFLAMVGAIVDVKRGKLTFEVGVENIKFILEKIMKKSSLRDSYCLVDIIDTCVQESASELPLTDKLEVCLPDSAKVSKENIGKKPMRKYWTKVPFPLSKYSKHM